MSLTTETLRRELERLEHLQETDPAAFQREIGGHPHIDKELTVFATIYWALVMIPVLWFLLTGGKLW